jgi:hypothetical protein
LGIKDGIQYIESVTLVLRVLDDFVTVDSDGILAVIDFAERTSDFYFFQVQFKKFLACGVVNNPVLLPVLGY